MLTLKIYRIMYLTFTKYNVLKIRPVFIYELFKYHNLQGILSIWFFYSMLIFATLRVATFYVSNRFKLLLLKQHTNLVCLHRPTLHINPTKLHIPQLYIKNWDALNKWIIDFDNLNTLWKWFLKKFRIHHY